MVLRKQLNFEVLSWEIFNITEICSQVRKRLLVELHAH